MEPKVSVIIPVYKAEKELRKCVESLVFGSYSNLEIILVEDCSPDNSWMQCRILEEEFPPVRCVHNEKNCGVSYTRNRGLSVASGEYICFVDSDDWVSGHFISRLVEVADAHENVLPICGFRFYEEMAGYTADYLWDSNGELLITVGTDQFFDLQKKVLLQSLCNKVFRNSVIQENKLSLDVNQSMGEDFQFVLDYMEAAGIGQCMVINEPLYYYIRANNASLMSKFGQVGRENELRRLAQLRRICGDDDSIDAQYCKAVDGLKKNYIYHAMHNSNLDKGQKLRYIQNVLELRDGSRTYQQYRLLLAKEGIAHCLSSMKRLPGRVSGRLQRRQRARFVQRQCQRFNASDQEISIISQNCIGGVLYHDMGLPFLSPTVNLYFSAPDFVRFVLDLDRYLKLDLTMTWDETYPVGYLEDVKIHFMHYHTCTEAVEAWNRRKTRLNRNKILVLCTDMEDFTQDVFAQWQKITYPKLLYTANAAFAAHPDTVFYPKYQEAGCVPDLIPKREFYHDGRVIAMLNQFGGE